MVGDPAPLGRISRRRFLRAAAGAPVAAPLLGAGGRAAAGDRARRRRARLRVAVLGGGIAGLSAAHELAERGFEVTVYDERRQLGGKARGIDVAGTARGDRRPLPAEHGFHFFLGGYENLSNTMRRVPFGSNERGVLGNLVPVRQIRFARGGGRPDFLSPVPRGRRPWTLDELQKMLIAPLEHSTDATPGEAAFLARRMLLFMTSSDARRFGQWERVSWWDFLGAGRFSDSYRRIFASLPASYAAAKPKQASSRTFAGAVESALYNAMQRRGSGEWERLLDAPKNEALFDPWIRHLRALGVRFRVRRTVEALEFGRGRVAAARVRGPRGTEQVNADWFVCALPVERARRLWTDEIRRADDRLEGTDALKTEWMSGVQFYLRERTDIARGTVGYVDAPWFITSVSQAQFWGATNLPSEYGDGTVRDCLSAVASNWDRPGIIFDKPARSLQPRRIVREIWAQMKSHVNDAGDQVLRDELVVRCHLDPAIRYRRSRRGATRRALTSREPLFVNTVGSWYDRPEAVTAIENLFLAGDYVRTSFDATSMECANEAARRAVNGLLRAAGSQADPAPVFTRYRPPEFEELRRIDARRYRQGQPHLFDAAQPR
jgi:uncharacterized protein with NAD-binding domain and iron-sulfur cluster